MAAVYGWSVVYNFPAGTLNWSDGDGSPKRINTNFKVTGNHLLELRSAINLLNAHAHGTSFNNPSISVPTYNVTTADKKAVFPVNNLRDFIVLLNNTAIHKHTYSVQNNQGHNCSGDFGWDYQDVDTTTIQPIFNTSWTQPVLDTLKKITAADINDLRLSIEQIDGHQHYYCTCNCNHCHTNCHSSCHSHCHDHCCDHCRCDCMSVNS